MQVPLVSAPGEPLGNHGQIGLHWRWVTAHLYEEQIPIGVTALRQYCCEPDLHSITEQCNTVFGKMHSPLLNAAVQSRFTAGLCQCNHTCGNLLFIQLCNDPTPLHRNTVQGKMYSHCSVLLCKSSSQQVCASAFTPMEICSSYRCALTQQQSTAALSLAKSHPTAQCCCAKQVHSRFVPVQSDLRRFALHTGVH